MDVAEYKHVVLGLIFLNYISDASEERYAQLLKEVDQGADPEDLDEYRTDNVFLVPFRLCLTFSISQTVRSSSLTWRPMASVCARAAYFPLIGSRCVSLRAAGKCHSLLQGFSIPGQLQGENKLNPYGNFFC